MSNFELRTEQDPRSLKRLKRYEHLKKRDALPPEERRVLSLRVCENLRKLLNLLPEAPLAFYAATEKELDLCALYNINARIYFPRVDSKTHLMDFFLVKSPQDFRMGPYGILEPTSSEKLSYQQKTIFIVPSLALARSDGTRLGFGGGFYDRYFEKHTDTLRIAPNFSFHIEDALPCEEFDKKVDFIVSETMVFRPNRVSCLK